ncbi:MAG TPA: hypothetical protein VGG26_09765, partial [Terracidiphilus sp.]
MLRARYLMVLALLLALAGTAGATAQSTSSKISPDLQALISSGSGNAQVIIQYHNLPSQSSGTSQPSGLLSGLLGGSSGSSGLLSGVLGVAGGLVGGLVTVVLGVINAVVAIVPLGQLNKIATDPNVAYISLDRPVSAREAVTITAAEYTTEPVN